VFLGTEIKTKKKVAIKKMTLGSDVNESEVAAEIHIMKTTVHENIIKLEGAYYFNDRLWVFSIFIASIVNINNEMKNCIVT
jgi:serine/threonine protein kinase